MRKRDTNTKPHFASNAKPNAIPMYPDRKCSKCLRRRALPGGRKIKVGPLILWNCADCFAEKSMKSIHQQMLEIGSKIPNEVWDKFPKDISENVDKYLKFGIGDENE